MEFLQSPLTKVKGAVGRLRLAKMVGSAFKVDTESNRQETEVAVLSRGHSFGELALGFRNRSKMLYKVEFWT